jgi:hypothetical protein
VRLLGLAMVLVAAGGCVRAPEGSRALDQAEAAAVDGAIREWPWRDDMERCAEERAHYLILVAQSHEEMVERTGMCGPGLCGRDQAWSQAECPWGCAAGAQRRYADGVWPFAFLERRWPLMVIWHEIEGARRAGLLRHEALHWLGRCTDRGDDRGHTDERW